MGSVLASTIFDEVDAITIDAAKVRWTDAEKLIYLNAGQRQIVLLKPDAYTISEVFQLVAGTKQSLPDGTASFVTPAGETIKECTQLVRVVRNMGTTGLVAGAAITAIGMDILDNYNPSWHSDTANAVVNNYVFNDADPRRFWVTPPQPSLSQGWVEAIMAAIPADLVATAGPSYAVAISLSDVYRDILRNYILHQCYAKDAGQSPLNAQRSVEYWNLFVMALDRKDLVQRQYSPNVRKENPSTE